MTAPILTTGDGTKRCEICRVWVVEARDHDRELHLIAALERLAAALESKAAE